MQAACRLRPLRDEFRLSGPFHNYAGIRPPIHPAPRRCSSVKYSRYSPSSRLAERASRRPRCVTVIMKRTTWVAALLVVAAGLVVAGQSPVDPKLLAELKRLFPSAISFSPKEGDPPHYNAYV